MQRSQTEFVQSWTQTEVLKTHFIMAGHELLPVQSQAQVRDDKVPLNAVEDFIRIKSY